MDQATMAKCFDEWMRRFIEEPNQFEHEFQSVQKFLSEASDGKDHTYGEMCSAYMKKIAGDLGIG